MSRHQLLMNAVNRGKYAPLFHYLSNRDGTEWRTSFGELEKILGFSLPDSARIYRPWWANDKSSGHSQSMSWTLAGWKTAGVDLDLELLTFRKQAEEKETMIMIPQRQSAPKMADFRNALRAHLLEARSAGHISVTIKAGELHRSVGGYPTPFNRMPMCCNAMYEEQKVEDRIIDKPKKNYGASLTIEYRLPRR